MEDHRRDDYERYRRTHSISNKLLAVIVIILIVVSAIGFALALQPRAKVSSSTQTTTTTTTVPGLGFTSTQTITSTKTSSFTLTSTNLVTTTATETEGTLTSTTTTTETSTSTSTVIQPASAPVGERFIRIRTLLTDSSWDPVNYTAEQILNMVSTLKPDFLERYITGYQDLSVDVPVCNGCQSMTAGQFLNASMQACGCSIIPRISLNDYANGSLYTISQELLSLPVYPKMHYLSLDDWAKFNQKGYTESQIVAMFQELYSQGWWGIGVNDCGGVYPDYGYATWADFCIQDGNSSPSKWVPDATQLSELQAESNIKLKLLYIDFPQPMADFQGDLTVDQQAQVISQNIAPMQSSEGFVFVYPILQSSWDANMQVTSKGSSYGGESLFALMLQLMNEYNQD